MHLALDISEIAELIFSHFYPESWTESAESYRRGMSPGFRNLAVVAQTCRAFLDSAIHHLWKSVPLQTLVFCTMPADLWTFAYYVASRNRPIQEADWERTYISQTRY
ncbi:hypothetical protein DFH08DRAFT_449760 [Mycena albidolilacea]|uniref:Uncharacterized protein n=1 Tax=Mycena albidolilacea TaxID=1033008 RepID=A0AAD6Z8V7_9AGAR|nr:hypothetical protein DFH08DRAFT_449760 [Mycena albidolilacea]